MLRFIPVVIFYIRYRTEEKKLNELPTEPLESMTDESLSPLRNIPLSVQSPARDDINIIVPDDIDSESNVTLLFMLVTSK